MENELIVLIPEKTLVRFRLAGLGSRVGAHMIDLISVFAINLVLGIGIMMSLGRVAEELALAILVVISGMLPFLYFILLEGFWNGSTVGKRLMGLRVRMADGTPITIFAAISRNVVRAGDFLPFLYFAGILAVMSNPKSQRFGDLVAGTVVVDEKRPNYRAVPAPHTAGLHYYESWIGDLRGMTLEEYQALRRLCDRFPELNPAIQARMLDEIWYPIATKRGIAQVANVHPLYLAEAVVMKYGREKGLL